MTIKFLDKNNGDLIVRVNKVNVSGIFHAADHISTSLSNFLTETGASF